MLKFSRIWVISLVVVGFLVVGMIFFRNHTANQVEASRVVTPAVEIHSIAPQTTPNPSPELVKTIEHNQLSGWFYPKSQLVESNDQELKLTSFGDPQVITDWYKAMIVLNGFSSKTFVSTNSNSNIINQLVGSDGNREVDIEIKRQAGSDHTLMTISMNPR